MNRNKIFSLLAITTVVATIGSVAALEGKFPGINPQSRDNITNAIKANDFNAWKEAMSAQLRRTTSIRLCRDIRQCYRSMETCLKSREQCFPQDKP